MGTKLSRRELLKVTAGLGLAAGPWFPAWAAVKSGVSVTRTEQTVRVEIDGTLFTEYHFQDAARPYFYPVIGPGGDPVTRNWPMKAGEHEDQDHPHHRSLWYSHGNVNGHDFWEEKTGHGRIVHDTFVETKSGPEVGIIVSRNNWVSDAGDIVCTDTRTHRFKSVPRGTLMDIDITFHASHGAVTLGDTKEGSMALRLAPTMRVRGDVAEGHIVNSEGDEGAEAWGKRAAWCDYYGPVAGKTVGVAIFDHPSNPKHPTWWHVRDYGLFSANPFGVHDFEEKPPGTGDIHIASGESLTFRYRLFFHLGDDEEAGVAEHYLEYAKK